MAMVVGPQLLRFDRCALMRRARVLVLRPPSQFGSPQGLAGEFLGNPATIERKMTTETPLIEAASGVIGAGTTGSDMRAPNDSVASIAVGVTFGDILRAYLTLMKPKVIVLLEIPTLAAMLIAQPELPEWWLVIVTLLAGAMAAGGSAAINCFVDRDIDALMGSRTQQRAIPSGLVSPRGALTFGVVLTVTAVVLLWAVANALAAFLTAVATFIYVAIYTLWLKRTTPSNIVLGGAAGAIPPLIGWAAVTGDLTATPWLLFALVFFWTPPHFWALALLIHEQYARARVPMLPVVRGEAETRRQIVLYTLQMIAVSLLLFGFGGAGVLYLGGATLLGGYFLYLSVDLMRVPSPAKASWLFHYSMIYLTALCVVIVADYRIAIW